MKERSAKFPYASITFALNLSNLAETTTLLMKTWVLNLDGDQWDLNHFQIKKIPIKDLKKREPV
ncbi:hypothetical protein [Leptospira interrogans]|nr:hypothetical protein [Leptospira interrogans]AKP25268.1 hypothetical protein LIMLP_04415 [Leptospira interrogans serovar Manilae]AKP29051.1 hypothetical protein LIMHP_04400 [Leptospira interrogans serovar Manilae]EMJ57898.1 hypothetical protein LEP1GSC013_4465 [Leptospira interrogans serovar Valbuzzi str. Duyster]ENO73553.1 hypothetical protein LEP1GSC012_1754 [Leptospira interrogans serovar Valbuzzi str. Valbuzzi]EYU61811.1 hypothetical protein CI00_03365 [Leptospira interrogans serovar Ma